MKTVAQLKEEVKAAILANDHVKKAELLKEMLGRIASATGATTEQVHSAIETKVKAKLKKASKW